MDQVYSTDLQHETELSRQVNFEFPKMFRRGLRGTVYPRWKIDVPVITNFELIRIVKFCISKTLLC